MILKMPFKKNQLVDFDESIVSISPVTYTSEKPKGNFHQLDQNYVALYALNDDLVLQINHEKWNISSEQFAIKLN